MNTDRNLATELATPKYAYIERERRWLVESSASPAVTGDGVLIEDLYITGTRMRLRRMTNSDGWTSLKLSKKYVAPDPSARPVVTSYLDEAEYDLLAALPGRQIIKRRHIVTEAGTDWSVDYFEGKLAGLVIAELEAKNHAALQAIQAPGWALREITHEQRWQSGALAQLDQLPEV